MPSVSHNNPNQDIAASAQLGFELGVLISGLNVSADVKQAWLTLLQAATPKQLIALNETFKHALLMQATKEADEVYANRLRQLVNDFTANQTKLDEAFEQELANLAAQIKSHSGGILI
jgi:LPS O-antigen subunit length determinant protein (WzzB/FepE family)